MKKYSFSELRSHPDRKLEEHLLEVGQLCQKMMSSKQINYLPDQKEALTHSAYIIGVCHDFGKSTSYFQAYIRGLEKRNPKTSHGLLSAVFTYYCMKKSTKINRFKKFPLFGFLCVKRHHGNLHNFRDEIIELRDIKIKNQLIDQVNALNSKVESIYHKLLPESDFNEFKNDLLGLIEEIRQKGKNFSRSLNKTTSINTYIEFQLLYSCLLSADKLSASELDPGQTTNLPIHLIDDLFKKKDWFQPKSSINKLRIEIYREVMSSINKQSITTNKVFSLNVPTGMGKTYTAFSFSLKLREKVQKKLGYAPKIIYCLPFLSIIDQNFDVIQKAFSEVLKRNPSGLWLTKHHHLSEAIFSTEKNKFTGYEGTFLIEGWISEIIITTFMQLFHTLISNRNKSLRKFNALVNSIIIFDEVQAFPHKFWLLVKNLVKILTNQFGSYVIFISATQPLIMDSDKNEIVELVTSKEKYFKSLNRVQLQIHKDPLHFDKFKPIIKNMIEMKTKKSFLIVLNTINSVKELYLYLRKFTNHSSSFYYLTTHIIPKERLKRIEDIKKDSNRKIIVSTQLIEAGIDIDVDIVIRDMGPLDSINQVAGRCNRNNTRDIGEVHIFTLKNDQQEYYKYIYSGFLINKTMEVLKDFSNPINERDFLALNNLYYRKIKQDHSNDTANELLNHVANLRFSYLNDQFKLIENQNYEKIDVFVEVDSKAKEIWLNFLELQDISNGLERKKAFAKFKRDFYEYVISVPALKAPPVEKDTFVAKTNLGLAYISEYELQNWYDLETGFNPIENGSLLL